MATASKLPSGKWRVRYVDPDTGKRSSKTFPGRREAREFEKDLLADRVVASGSITFAEWSERWWSTHTSHLKESTLYNYRLIRDRYLLPFFGPMTMNDIRSRDVSTWFGWASARTGPAHVDSCATLMSTMMEAAVRDGVVGRNPMRSVKRPPVRRKEARFLKTQEIADLADCIKPELRPMIYLGAYCGLRVGELCGLKWSDIDGQTLTVRRTATKAGSKWTTGSPKTKNSNRTIAMPGKVSEMLRELGDDSEWVFPNAYGGMLSPGNFRDNYFRKAATEAELLPLVPHDLRHTAVSLWIKNGANPKEVAARAGHASVSEVFDRYGHLYDSADRELADKLDDEVI